MSEIRHPLAARLASETPAEGVLTLRYEDIAQDGRILLGALPAALGVVWKNATFPGDLSAALRRDAILPILTRIEAHGDPGPFAVEDPIRVRGSFALAHSVDEGGAVNRLLLDVTADLHGVLGRTNLPPPEGRGEPTRAGRLYVEHVFTKPFAPKNDRKVLAFDLGEESFVPSRRRDFRPARSVLEVEPGATPLDPRPVADGVPLALGLMHTDSNQHVNSLVYPRWFEEAALRRLRALGRPLNVLARSLVVTYRRPSFAGDVLSVRLRAYELGKSSVVVGGFYGEGDPEDDESPARAYVRLDFA